MALILKIERKLRTKNVFCVKLNTGEMFEVYDEQIILNSLKEGKEIEIAEIEKIAKQSQEKIANDYCIQSLSRGMKTRREMAEKLKQKQFDSKVIEGIIEKMEQYGYLNDLAFATSYFS